MSHWKYLTRGERITLFTALILPSVLLIVDFGFGIRVDNHLWGMAIGASLASSFFVNHLVRLRGGDPVKEPSELWEKMVVGLLFVGAVGCVFWFRDVWVTLAAGIVVVTLVA